MAGKGTPGTGATFTIAERRSQSVFRSGRAYNSFSAEPTDDTPEPTTQEPTPGPTPGSADIPARCSHLLLGDLDTDLEEELTAEEIIQRKTPQTEESATATAAAHQTSETELPPGHPTTSRWRAPSILGVFRCQTSPRVPSREHREQSLPDTGTFIPDTPERLSRPRNSRQPPK